MEAVFVSYNRADREAARALATALVLQGAGVWYDEWEVEPGSSITTGIEAGLASATVFALLWSSHAAASAWVKSERHAYLRRRIDDQSLRVVPIMLDDTPLPTLMADYSGFRLAETDVLSIASRIGGTQADRELARRLQHASSIWLPVSRSGGTCPCRTSCAPSVVQPSFAGTNMLTSTVTICIFASTVRSAVGTTMKRFSSAAWQPNSALDLVRPVSASVRRRLEGGT